MRITKYLHSCILIEDHGRRLLIDPGTYAFIEGLVRLDDIPRLDGILITHPHKDHLDPAIVRELRERDGAEVLGSRSIAELLAKEGVIATPVEGCDVSAAGFRLCATPAPHEQTLVPPVPENVAYLVNDRFLHPGDSLSDALFVHRGVEAIALPVVAPWSSEPRIAEFARALAPRHVIPIHDGYLKSFFQEAMYERYRAALEPSGITFNSLREPGEGMTLA